MEGNLEYHQGKFEWISRVREHYLLAVLHVLQEKGHFPLIDNAYLGFASG